MSGTPATAVLHRSGIAFTEHVYEVADDDDLTYGEAVARDIGVPAARVFKTLVAVVDGAPVVAIVPASELLSPKKLARARGGKRAAMAEPHHAERLTGYVVGGISPFGQKRRLPMLVDRTALDHATVYVSGGRRGIQLELSPADLLAVTGALPADLTG